MRILLLAAVLCACKATGTFKCLSSEQCRLGNELGFCEDSGNCTFSDSTCESQRRYDETAEYPLAGECLSGYVTGRVIEQYIVNDKAGAPTLVERAPETLEISAELDDGTQPDVRTDHDGAFSFPAPPGAHYTVMVPAYGDLQSSAPHLEISSFSPARPDPVRATKPTQIKFTYNAPPLGNLWIASTGAFTETRTSATATNFDFDWFTARADGGAKPALLSSELHDRLYVNQTANIGGYISIVASATEQLDLVDGVTTTVMGELAPTIRDQCVQLRTNAMAEEARLKSAQGALANMKSRWWFGAAQARDVTPGGSFTLAVHDDPSVTNANLNVTYANPFAGTEAIGWTTVEGTYAEPAAGFSLALPMFSEVYMPFDSVPGSCAATLTLSATAAIGGALVVGGTGVDASDKQVTTDVTKRVPVAWSQTVSGVASYWWIGIYEISDDGAGGLVFKNLYWIATPDTHVLLPPDLLESGHTYVAQLLAEQGIPKASQGDFVTTAYPVAQTGSWSKSFKIK